MIDLFRLQKTLAGYHSVAVERWLARSQLHQTQHGGRYVKSWRLPDSDGQNLSKSTLEFFTNLGQSCPTLPIPISFSPVMADGTAEADLAMAFLDLAELSAEERFKAHRWTGQLSG